MTVSDWSSATACSSSWASRSMRVVIPLNCSGRLIVRVPTPPSRSHRMVSYSRSWLTSGLQSFDGGRELADRASDDVGHGPHAVDAPGDLPAEGDGRLHVAAEVEGLGVAEVAEHVVLGVLQ